MTRKMKLNRLRAEIASVQGRIMAAHSNPAGTEELASLVMQESALKQKMYEESLFYDVIPYNIQAKSCLKKPSR